MVERREILFSPHFGVELTGTDTRGDYHRPVHETFDLVNEESRAQEAGGHLGDNRVHDQLPRSE